MGDDSDLEADASPQKKGDKGKNDAAKAVQGKKTQNGPSCSAHDHHETPASIHNHLSMALAFLYTPLNSDDPGTTLRIALQFLVLRLLNAVLVRTPHRFCYCSTLPSQSFSIRRSPSWTRPAHRSNDYDNS